VVVRGDEEEHRFGAHTVEKQEPLGVGEEIAVLLKRRQLDPEGGACVHVHYAAAMRHCCVCRCLVVVVLVLVNHHPVPREETQFPSWTISGGASPWLADCSRADVLRRIDGEQLLTDLPDSVLD
jgi:hypothetical protein